MKMSSADVPHKTEVAGVVLDVRDADVARATFRHLVDSARSLRPDALFEGVVIQEMVKGVEVIVGGKRDAQVGPVVVVGLGGVLVEMLHDVAVRPAPVSPDEVRAMLAELRGSVLLWGWRGTPPADVDALARLVSRFSLLLSEAPHALQEIELNPVVVLSCGHGAKVVDALVIRPHEHEHEHGYEQSAHDAFTGKGAAMADLARRLVELRSETVPHRQRETR